MKHVLIVEDDPQHAFILQAQINKMGLLSSVCVNVFTILDRVKQGLVDAITVDLNMPDIDGGTLIDHIRRVDKNIPIIVITARGEFARVECLQKGANYYLVKPIDSKDLRMVFEHLNLI